MEYDGSVRINTKADNSGIRQGVAEATAEIKKINSALDAVNIKITKQTAVVDNLRKRYDEAAAAAEKIGKDQGIDSADYENAAKAVDQVANNLFRAEDKLSELNAQAEALNNTLSSTNAGSTGELASRFGAISKAAQTAGRFAASAFRAVQKPIVLVAKGAAKAAHGILGIAKNMLTLGRHSRSAQGGIAGLTSRLGRLMVAALVFNVIRRALSELRKDLGAVLMANTQFATSWNAIKVNMLTAFAPIWETIQPAIITFMELLARFTAVLAQFMALLFGRTISQSRDTAKALNDQAKSLDSVGGSAKKAGKFLASFDQINQAAADTAGGGGSAGNALDFGIAEPPDLSWLDVFAEKIKNIFKDVDLEYWSGLGAKLGDLIMTGLNKIPWGKIKSGAKTLAANLASIINGALSSNLGFTFGSSIAEALNTIVEFLTSFGENLDFANIGETIAGAINGFFETFDFTRLAEGISVWTLGILNTLTTAIADTDWTMIGDKIGEFISNIDWAGIMAGVWSLIREAFLGAFDLATGLAGGAGWENLAASFQKLKDVVEPLVDSVGNIIMWLWNEVLTPLISWYMNVYYPALIDNVITPFVNLANVIIDIVWPAFQNIWEKVLKPIAQWIGSAFITILESMGAIFKKVTGAIQGEAGGLGDALKGLGDVLSILWNEIAKPILDLVLSVVNVVFDTIGNLIAGAITALRGLMDFIVGIFTGDWEKAWNGIKDFFRGIWNMIVSILEGAVNIIIRGINFLIGALNSISFNVPDWVPLIGGKSFGFSITPIREISIPRLAAGGIVDSATIAMIGERGKEAIVPLENNAEWMQPFREMLEELRALRAEIANSRQGDPVFNVNGREFARATYDDFEYEGDRRGMRIRRSLT